MSLIGKSEIVFLDEPTTGLDPEARLEVWKITVTIMPVALMLLFVYVLGGALQTGTDNCVNYLLPGILLIAIANSIGYTSFRLFNDMQQGIFERFHSMPIARSAALWGHVLTSLVSNAISVIVVILVALIMGFRSPAGVRIFAENQPVTAIVEAIRSLLSGQQAGNDIWIALGWCILIMLVGYVFAMRVYKKRE